MVGDLARQPIGAVADDQRGSCTSCAIDYMMLAAANLVAGAGASTLQRPPPLHCGTAGAGVNYLAAVPAALETGSQCCSSADGTT